LAPSSESDITNTSADVTVVSRHVQFPESIISIIHLKLAVVCLASARKSNE